MDVEQLMTFLISPERTIVEAMEKIDENGRRILFITNTDRKLIGAITDGDIRRWLIKTGNLQEQISRLMNRNPKSVYRREVASAQDVMRRYSITALPVLNSKGIVIDILFEQEQKTEVREGSLSLDKVPVVIMAGGKGTRLYPYTKILPKPLIPIGDIPIMERIIDKFRDVGVTDFYATVNYRKNMIKSYFTDTAKDYEIQRVDSSSWDGSAVAEQTAKPRSIKRAASAKNTSGTVTTLLSDVYASAKPQLLQTASGKKLLIFTTDMGDRTTGNHTAVVYSIYNERGWSIPKLIDDDGTADFDAVAAVDGENVYVTWINAKRTFTPEEAEAEDFMTKLAAETEVQAAKIALNGNTGTVTKYPAITDNAIADLHPSITVKNHVPYIAWNSNSANDILKGTGTNTVYLASLNGNAFTTKKLSEENKPVQSVAIGNLDNDVVTAYTLNSGTEENPQVQLTAVNAKGRTTIAANGQNVSPSFAKIDGSSVLLWYAQDAEGSSLNYIDTIDGEVESYIEDDAVTVSYTHLTLPTNSLV